MRRADRLFRLVQLLRKGKVLTARRLAEELEVSERTIYRDVRDLVLSGVPIDGEAGVGYVLQRGFDLPPLMFNVDELEALAFGARLVSSWADDALARGARDALAKIEAVVPAHLRQRLDDPRIFALNFRGLEGVAAHLALLRRAIDERHKVGFDYVRGDGTPSSRTVRPLCLSFVAPIWMLTAWCELRGTFRTFRLDRMESLTTTSDRFDDEPGRTLEDFLALVRRAPSDRREAP